MVLNKSYPKLVMNQEQNKTENTKVNLEGLFKIQVKVKKKIKNTTMIFLKIHLMNRNHLVVVKQLQKSHSQINLYIALETDQKKNKKRNNLKWKSLPVISISQKDRKNHGKITNCKCLRPKKFSKLFMNIVKIILMLATT